MLLTILAVVVVAELGAKTRLATLLFATGKEVSKWTVFIGAASALIAASAIAVAAGGVVSHYMSEKFLRYLAGGWFI